MLIRPSIIGDGGPIYTETLNHVHSHSDSWLIEPYNAMSALLFIVIAVVWWWRLRGQFAQQKFLVYGLILLTIGGVGGTLYHALRTEPVYLLMDWMPIVILSLSVTYWFFMKQTKHRWLALLYVAGGLVVIFASFPVMVRLFQWRNAAGSVAYSMAALQAVLPIVVYLYRTRFRHAGWFFAGIGSFALAAIFRATDHDGLLPMGTHFLWHTFGAIMAYLLLEFVYRVESSPAEPLPRAVATGP